jgi:predicted nucleic acid-binding protein
LILLDTDILIDVALDRQPYSVPAPELLDRLEGRPDRAFIAWHTVSNFYYIVAPRRGGKSTRQFILELTRFVSVAATGTDALRFAFTLPMTDFEDAMQVAAARICGAQHIVTRNFRDFARSPIPAVGPEQALAELV